MNREKDPEEERHPWEGAAIAMVFFEVVWITNPLEGEGGRATRRKAERGGEGKAESDKPTRCDGRPPGASGCRGGELRSTRRPGQHSRVGTGGWPGGRTEDLVGGSIGAISGFGLLGLLG